MHFFCFFFYRHSTGNVYLTAGEIVALMVFIPVLVEHGVLMQNIAIRHGKIKTGCLTMVPFMLEESRF